MITAKELTLVTSLQGAGIDRRASGGSGSKGRTCSAVLWKADMEMMDFQTDEVEDASEWDGVRLNDLPFPQTGDC